MTKPSFPPDFGVRLANLESRLKELERPQFRAKPNVRDLSGVGIGSIADGNGVVYDKDLGQLVPASLALAVHAHDYAAPGHTHADDLGRGARRYRTTDFSVPAVTGFTAVSFQATWWDNDGIVDAGDATKLVCRTAGFYVITCGGLFQQVAGVDVSFTTRILLNGSSYLGDVQYSSDGGAISQEVTTIANLAVGDYVQMIVDHTHSSAVNLICFERWSPRFGMQRVGRA